MSQRGFHLQFCALLVMLVVGLWPASLRAAERFYMITFGVQDYLNKFTTAHTFAVFVRAESEGNDFQNAKLETRVISWLPKSGVVCMICPAEVGRNYPLDQSLSEPAADGRSITAWGPYEIQPELYRRASVQMSELERGALLYKAVDEPYRHLGIATNCEHAVSDIDTDNGMIYTGTAHGNRGTRHVTKHLHRWVIPASEDLRWLFKRLGIDQYPIHAGTL